MTGPNAHLEAELDRPERVEAIISYVAPAIDDLLRRVEGDEFTTQELIEIIQIDPSSKAVYDEALRRWGEGERYAKMVVHGQVIPAILRRSGRVEWLGFAHGQEDSFAVPSRWRLLAEAEEVPGLKST